MIIKFMELEYMVHHLDKTKTWWVLQCHASHEGKEYRYAIQLTDDSPEILRNGRHKIIEHVRKAFSYETGKVL